MTNQAIEALRRAISSSWLSIDFDHNRTPEALDVRRQIIAAIDQAEKASAAQVYVTMEGGICQGVSTNDPALVGAEYVVIDYDCSECDPHDSPYIRDVVQPDGSTQKAFIGGDTIGRLAVKIGEGA